MVVISTRCQERSEMNEEDKCKLFMGNQNAPAYYRLYSI